MTLHGLQKNKRCGKVITVVFQGISDGFTDKSESCKVQHRLRLILRKKTLDQSGVAHVAFYQCDMLQRQRFTVTEDEIIQNDDLFPKFK